MSYGTGSGSASGSSRGSLMTMPGAALDPMGGEITYTPTTHRISKAKKGKKVHACEYPGCTKVCSVLGNHQGGKLMSVRSSPEQSIASMAFKGHSRPHFVLTDMLQTP